MKQIATLFAVAVTALCAGNASAQCVGCSQGVTPSFSQSVYTSSAPVYLTRRMTYARATICNTGCNTSCNTGCGTVVVAQPVCGCSTPCCSTAYGTYTRASAYGFRRRVVYRQSATVGCSTCGGTVVTQPVFNGTVQPVAPTPASEPVESTPPTPTPVADGT